LATNGKYDWTFKETYEKPLNPKDFLNATANAEIKDLKMTETIGPKGSYKQYFLEIAGLRNDDNSIPSFDVGTLMFLFENDLRNLKKIYGLNPAEWVGKQITIKGLPDGKYFRWELHPKVQ